MSANSVSEPVEAGLPRSSNRRPVYIVGGLAGLVLVYALAGFVLAPSLIKSRLPVWVSQQLKRQASIGEVKVNPFTLRLEARDFRLNEADGRPLGAFTTLVADLEWSSIWRRAWHVLELRLVEPAVALDIAPDGSVNLARLVADLTRDAPKQSSNELPRLVIYQLSIEKGKAAFSDRRAGYSNSLAPIDFQLQHLSTLREDKGPYTFSASTANGGSLGWKGEIALNPLAASGTISAKDISLPDLAAYLKPFSTAHIAAGKLGFELPYRLSYRDGRLDAAVQGAGATLAGLTLSAGAQEAEPLLTLNSVKLESLDADYARREAKLAALTVDGGKLSVKRDARGRIDWLDLVQTPGSPAAPAAPAVQSATAQATLSPSAIAVSEAVWKASVGRIGIDNVAINLRDQSAQMPVTVAAGNFKMQAAVDAEAGVATNVVVKELGLRLAPLTVAAAGATPVRVGSIDLEGGALDLAARKLSASALRISEGQVKLQRNPQGQINLLALLPKSPGTAAEAVAGPKESATKVAPWAIALGKAEVSKTSIDVEEQETGIAVGLQAIALELTDASNDPKQPLKFTLGLEVKEGGKLAAQGRLMPSQSSAEVNFKLEKLALKPVQPLIDKFVKLQLKGGLVSASGKLTAGGGAKATLLRYAGSAELADLQLVEEGGEPFATWKSVGADQVSLTLQPNALDVAELRVVEPNAKLLIEADRSLNAQRLLVRPPATPGSAASAGAAVTAPATANPDPAQDLFPVNVRRVRVSNGKLEFADLSLRPQFGARIHELNGVINGLSTARTTRSQLELDGRVDEFGLARIRGELNPFVPRNNTDVGVVFKNVDLVSASPYSMKFAGYKIASGKISLDLKYKVRDGKLDGENNVVLDQLTLGERVDSPDAMNLPLELALAILKDSDGKIDLDLPVSGSLDDPQFSYGAIVWKAITNVLTKIVTAPFRALGALFGISGDKLESIDFDAGSAALLPPEREKLKQVATVLAKRSQLKLGVPGHYNEAVDGAALRVRAVRLEVAKRAGIRVAEGEEPGPPDLQDRSVRSALRAMLIERHGNPEWDKRKAEAEQAGTAAGATISMLERAQRLTQGDPQVADLGPLYRGITERLVQSQTLPADALRNLGQRRAQVVADAVKGAGVDAARVLPGNAETVEASQGKAVPLKLGLSSR